MLVITRRRGETLVIGEDIRICIVDVDGSQVRVGIDAPPAVPVLRKELLVDRGEQGSAPSLPGEAVANARRALAAPA